MINHLVGIGTGPTIYTNTKNNNVHHVRVAKKSGKTGTILAITCAVIVIILFIITFLYRYTFGRKYWNVQ